MPSFLKRLFGRAVKPAESAAPTASTRPGIAANKKAQPDVGAASEKKTSARLDSEVFNEPLKHKTPDRSGGVYINGGTITVGGDIVGGDRIVVVSDGTIDRLFEPLLAEAQKIEPDALRVEARQRIIEIRDQAKRYRPDSVAVGKSLKWLMVNTPGLVPQLCRTLADPCLPQSVRELAVVVLVG
jgi:hypothetical protein